MKTLELIEQIDGQWQYRITITVGETTREYVGWQYGPRSREATIRQARERFGEIDRILG